jgi:hypothetical protein
MRPVSSTKTPLDDQIRTYVRPRLSSLPVAVGKEENAPTPVIYVVDPMVRRMAVGREENLDFHSSKFAIVDAY